MKPAAHNMMTPLERTEALYEELLEHYGDGDEREVRAAAKLLLVALDRFRTHGGPGWSNQVKAFLDIARYEPQKFDALLEHNRGVNRSPCVRNER